MSEALHYPFPPASAYTLNRCLYAIKSDRDFCTRFLDDPAGALATLDLTAPARAALSPIDRDALVAMGAHPYLVFMADLRLRQSRDPGGLEFF